MPSSDDSLEIFNESNLIKELDCDILFRIIERIIIYENKKVEIIFKYQDIYNDIRKYMLLFRSSCFNFMLVKEGYDLYFYKDESRRLKMDFFVRNLNSLIPVEVKANDNSTISLNNLISNDKYKDIKYGIKLCNKNIGFNGKFYTFPYFMTFLIKRFLKEKNNF